MHVSDGIMGKLLRQLLLSAGVRVWRRQLRDRFISRACEGPYRGSMGAHRPGRSPQRSEKAPEIVVCLGWVCSHFSSDLYASVSIGLDTAKADINRQSLSDMTGKA